MIPRNSIASIYIKIVGENSLLSIAQSNLLSNLERTAKVRTHTFFANNAQTEFGISRNFGHERYYSWEDTIIDCRNNPTLVNSDILKEIDEIITETPRFQRFKRDIEKRTSSLVKVKAFHNILLGEENMRYNIRCSSKIEDFDIVRVGIKLFADSDEVFKQGMKKLYDCENPFKIRVAVAQA